MEPPVVVVGMSSEACQDPAITGGKGSSLAVLASVVDVPPFFVVSSFAFRQLFQEDGKTVSLVEDLQKQTEWSKIDQRSKALRRHIKSVQLSKEVQTAIESAYEILCSSLSEPDLSVAVRSSGTVEDSADASFAGQHSTYLNQQGKAAVVLSVKKCWASLFNSRASEYRNKNNIKHSSALLAVVVQAMVVPTVAGTGFSCELASGGFPGLNVTALWGLGEGLVSGDLTADDWLFAPGSLCLIRRVKGSKTARYQCSKGGGIELVENTPELRNAFCLSTELARDIASKLARVHAHYQAKFGYEHVDTEFAVGLGERVFFLQCRPVVPVSGNVMTVADGHPEDVIVAGRFSLPGAVVGRVNCVTFESLVNGTAKIEEDSIVVSVKTGNAWTPFLKHLRGLVTEEGSPTSHPMLIGRERGIAVLVGVPGALDTLSKYQGEVVTLDGLQKRLYLGDLKLKSASALDMRRRFLPPPFPVLQSDDDSRKFLKNFSRGFLDPSDQSSFWSALSEHGLSPFWADMLAQSLLERLPILKRCSRGEFAHANLLCNDVRFETAKDGRLAVFDKLVPIDQTMRLFSDIDPSLLIKDREDAISEYLLACSDFGSSGSKEAFERYQRAWKMFFAHKWLSWFFRTSLEHAMAKEAILLNVSEMHLDLLIEQQQLKLSSSDLDLCLYREIKRLACFDVVDPKEVSAIAREFKIGKNTDISEEPPVELIALKVSQRRSEGSSNTNSLTSSKGQLLLVSGEFSDVTLETDLFPEADGKPVRDSVSLCVLARRQHSNAHHLLMKGQWIVRDKLVALFGKKFFERKHFF